MTFHDTSLEWAPGAGQGHAAFFDRVAGPFLLEAFRARISRRGVQRGTGVRRGKDAGTGATSQNMTFHDALPIPPRHFDRPEGAEKSFKLGAWDRGAVPERYLHDAARRFAPARFGRYDGRGRSRPWRSVWETMLKPAKTGSGRRAENGGFPPKKGGRRRTCDEKKALDRPVGPVADRKADHDAS